MLPRQVTPTISRSIKRRDRAQNHALQWFASVRFAYKNSELSHPASATDSLGALALDQSLRSEPIEPVIGTGWRIMGGIKSWQQETQPEILRERCCSL